MKIKRSALILLVTASLLVGTVVGAAGADVAREITATLRPDLNIEVNGERQALVDASGNAIYPILYNGSTYVPFRAVGDLLGAEVGWDQTTQTASYTTANDPGQPGKPAQTEDKRIDLIDDAGGFDPPYKVSGYPNGIWWETVTSANNRKAQVAGRVLDHWIRSSMNTISLGATFTFTESRSRLTFTAYSSYDTTVTVYNNGTKDSVLGQFNVEGGADPTVCTVDLKGAVEIRIEQLASKGATMNDYLYLYDMYLE